MQLIKPKALGKGSTIGVAAPAIYLEENAINQSIAVLERMGFKTYVHPTNHARHHCRAGTARKRADAINDLFADPAIDGILCARGGSGCMRTQAHLDYDTIRNNPKVFCGYSDITLLLHSIFNKTGLVTFHGPMLKSFTDEDGITLGHFAEVVGGNKVSLDITTPDIIQKGKARGPLTGGNLTLLSSLLGTPDAPQTEGAILFIEDINEEHYALDRALWHLLRAGKLDNIAGVMIGELVNVRESHLDYGITTKQSILEIFGKKDIPIVGNVPCGHGKRIGTFPLGVQATLSVMRKTASLTLTESAVELPCQNQKAI